MPLSRSLPTRRGRRREKQTSASPRDVSRGRSTAFPWGSRICHQRQAFAPRADHVCMNGTCPRKMRLSSIVSSAAGQSFLARQTRRSLAGNRRRTIRSSDRRATPGTWSGPPPDRAVGQPPRSPVAWDRSPPGATAEVRFVSRPVFAASTASSRRSVWCRCSRHPSLAPSSPRGH
jgi:hypothetical protein